MRLRFVILAVPAVSLLAACTPCAGAYLTGVYWTEEHVYYLDVTLHNNEPDDEWWIHTLWVYPGAFEAQAPPFWYTAWSQDHVAWRAHVDHWLPPGEELSGFAFQTLELAEEYSYKIHGYGFGWRGHFTPEPIPLPPAAGPVALAMLGLWAARRLRKS